MDSNITARKRISTLIGEPINPSLNTPVEISELAYVAVAEPGDKVYRYDSYDADVDQVLDIDTTTADVTAVKRTPLSETELIFKGLDSQREYVHLHDVMNSPDQGVFGRKKRRISSSMDKLELRIILEAINNGTTPTMAPGNTAAMEDAVQAVTPESGNDLYDIIMKAKHLVEDYGDDLLLLNGTTVNNKLDVFDKEKAASLNYNVTIRTMLEKAGIKPLKIFGKVMWTGGDHGAADDTVATKLMDANSFILESRNSRIQDEKGQISKPIIFVRKKITPELADFLGATVDKAQRALMVSEAPVQVGSTAKMAFSVIGVEEIIWAIVNPLGLVKSGDISDYL